MNLEQTAASMLVQTPLPATNDLQKQEQMLEKLGTLAFGGMGVVIGVGILALIYMVLVKMVLSGTQPFTGIGLIAFIIFAALALAYVFLRETINEKRKKVETAPGLRLEEFEMPRGRLADGADFEPVPSVTEDTTELLQARKITRDLE